MRITLSVGQPISPTVGVLHLNGNGIDGVNEFTIDGLVWMTGKVEFWKKYVGMHTFLYSGRLLPWGMVGRWGDSSGGFWLWPNVY